MRDIPVLSNSTHLLRVITLTTGLMLANAVPAIAQPAALDNFFASFTDAWVRANPDQAVSAAYFSGEEQNRMEQQLTPLTPQWERDRIGRARAGLAQLAAIDRQNLNPSLTLAAEVMQWQLQTLIESEPYLDYSFPLNQYNGANVSLVNTLTVVHPFQDTQDAENYLIRLSLLDERLQEATDQARWLDEQGIRPPAFILRSTIDQLQRFIRPAPRDNPLTTTLLDKTSAMTGLDEARRQAMAAQATAMVANEIYPAFERAVILLQGQVPRATEDAGLWRFANGAEHYAYQLKRFTTTDLGAEEIHEIGLQEVARIEGEMDLLFTRLGIVEGSLLERAAVLQERLAFPDNDAGRQAIMARIEVILADALQRTATLFDKRPVTPIIARPYPEFRWANAAASYTSPPLDGSRPGVFQMPLRPERLTEYRLRTLVYHETVPGHHYQIALTAEDDTLPKFMQIRALGGISAITEGWALYAERLAAESGWYADDIAGLIGQLDSALFRARRLVVDTGLHAKGWTRQQAIDYGIEASEVERYVINPGQACSYMMGQLKLVELREKTRAALGENFSIREFHNLVLGTGIVPLAILEGVVDRYIATTMNKQ